MTVPSPLPDASKWQQLYPSSDSRWKDLERTGTFLMPIIVLAIVAFTYVFVGYASFYSERLVPEQWTWFSTALYILEFLFIIFAPLIAVGLGLFFILKQAAVFMHSFYQPPLAEYKKLAGLIQRRLLGVIPVPPPLDNIFKYPAVVIQKPSLDEKYWWTSSLGGPATLIIYDGIALYLERGNHFSRVVGPGLPMPFLEQHERIKEVVDLRPQTKTDMLKPWTKDGIRIELKVRIEFQINASLEAIAQSSRFMFPFDPIAVKTAVERMTVKLDPKRGLYEGTWSEGAWGTITGIINAYVAGHSLDELFFESSTERKALSSNAENGEAGDIAVVSQKIRDQIQKAQSSLAQNGIKVLAVHIEDVKVPKEVQQFRAKYWISAKERVAAIRNSRAEADRIRIREQAHAEAQKTMLNAITQRLEKIDPDNLTEPLILSLSGLIDQGLDDPIVRPLIAKESFAVLERVRRMLRDGF